MIVSRVIKVKDFEAAFFPIAFVISKSHLYTIFEEVVFVAIRGEQGLGGAGFDYLPDCVLVGSFGEIGVKLYELCV